jgi:hypothetical protein
MSESDELICKQALDRLLEKENPGGNRGDGGDKNLTSEKIIQNES